MRLQLGSGRDAGTRVPGTGKTANTDGINEAMDMADTPGSEESWKSSARRWQRALGKRGLRRGGLQAREGAWVLGEATQQVLAWRLWSWVLLDPHPSANWLARDLPLNLPGICPALIENGTPVPLTFLPTRPRGSS